MTQNKLIVSNWKMNLGLSDSQKLVKQIIKSKIEANLKNLDLVNREEFEEIKSMIIKAREQNSILEAKIKTLEKKLKNRK